MTQVRFDPQQPRFADVNHYHPVRDFAAYARAASAGALGFKVNQGTWVDPTAGQHLSGSEAQNLIALGYAYGADSVETFLRVFPPQAGRIPVLDFEGDVTVAGAEAWIGAVHAAWGRYPWFYGRAVWIRCGQPSDTMVAQCPFWGAEYGELLNVPNGVGTPVAFQFSDGTNGPLPHDFAGVGPCDVDMLVCTVAELAAFAGLSGVLEQATG